MGHMTIADVARLAMAANKDPAKQGAVPKLNKIWRHEHKPHRHDDGGAGWMGLEERDTHRGHH